LDPPKATSSPPSETIFRVTGNARRRMRDGYVLSSVAEESGYPIYQLASRPL
jgi:hypothetical protein